MSVVCDKAFDADVFSQHCEVLSDYFGVPVAVALKHNIAETIDMLRLGTEDDIEDQLKTN